MPLQDLGNLLGIRNIPPFGSELRTVELRELDAISSIASNPPWADWPKPNS